MCKKLIFLISFVLVLVSASGLARAANEIWREAESADPLTAPMVKFTDDPNASGGAYIGAAAGNNSTAASPAPAGTASYILDIPAAGTYKVVVRIKLATDTIDDDSSYARIDGATYSSGSGWIKWNNNTVKAGTNWSWVTIFNNDASDAEVNFTMDAGQYVLEIAYREDGMYFDGILVTDDLALDVTKLPAELPAGGGGSSCVEANILVNGSFEDGFAAPWVFDNASPTNVIVDDAEHGEKALKVTVAAKGSQDYIPALAQPGLSFAAGKKYTFSVFMKGEVDGLKVQLKPQQRGGSYTGYGQTTVTLTTEWAEYSTTTPVFSAAVTTADVSIWLGMQAGTIYIDHVRFYEGDYVAPCPPPGSGGSELLPGLVNRYSFKDGDTDAIDSVGGMDGTLQGTATIAGNKLVLNGSGAAYLPSDILDPALTSLTVEAWMDISSATTWARAFDFGGSSGSNGGNTFYFVPNNNNNASQLTVSTTGFPSWQTGEQSVTSDGLAPGVSTHVACIFDGSVPEIRYYMNGELKARLTTTMELSKVARENAFIGDSSYSGDPYFKGNVDEFRIYNRALTDGDVLTSFNAGPDASGGTVPAVVKATKPEPASGSTDLPRETTLSWKKGDYADSHNVYLGTSSQAVTDATVDAPMGVLVSIQQPDASYAPVGIDYGLTYYWRIDEVNEADMTITKGNIWSFSTKAIGLFMPQASITASASSSKDDTQGPINTINGSGLTGNVHSTDSKAMWLSATTTAPDQAWIQYNFDKVYKLPRMLIWNYNVTGLTSGISIKGVTIEYSADGGQTWKVLPDVNELPKGTGSPIIVNLGGVANGIAADAIRITANSNWSTAPKFSQYGLSEVKFYYIPVWPTTPNPANGATGVGVKPTLTWKAGEGVVEHRVFFGTDEQAVTDGTAASYTVANPSFATPELALEGAYYWRVEEVNMAADPNAWTGGTWSFSVSPYRVVDDFEGSSLKWSGGSSSSGNGAAAALDSALANNGSKSMKLMYDNRSTQGYSEASATVSGLTSGTNWTTGGSKYLVFWVYGDTANVNTEKLYVKLNDSAVYWYTKTIIPDAEVVSPWWTQVTLPLQSDVVTLNNVTKIGIGFRNTDSIKAGTGVIHIDDIRLYKNAPVPTVPANPSDANLVARYKMENNVNDSTSHAINGTIIGNPQFVANTLPAYGKALVFDANQDCVDLGPSTPFNFTGSFTISLWANIANWGSEWGSVMVATRGEGTEGFQVRRGGSWVAGMQGKLGTGLSFTTRGISLAGMSNSEDMIVAPPALNRWTHIVCVYDKENSVKQVYFDSKLIQTSATPAGATLSPTTKKASLGARANSGDTGFEGLFNGSLDEVRLYNRALTEAEVKFLADPTP